MKALVRERRNTVAFILIVGGVVSFVLLSMAMASHSTYRNPISFVLLILMTLFIAKGIETFRKPRKT